MEIEKKLTVSAPPQQVWNLLLNPQIMAGAVPGMKSIEVISPTEYVAEMHQKISFISAKFKLKTKIVEQLAPEYMRVEGTGEDASVASSLKQTSEVFLTALPEGGTELRIKVTVDVLGRLGAFGLSVMKTKADRLWDEFANNLAARLEAGDIPANTAVPAPAPSLPTSKAAPAKTAVSPQAAPQSPVAPAPSIAAPPSGTDTKTAPTMSQHTYNTAPAVQADSGWWSRVFGSSRSAQQAGKVIRIEVRQMDKTISVEWPVEAAAECRDWLQSLQKSS